MNDPADLNPLGAAYSSASARARPRRGSWRAAGTRQCRAESANRTGWGLAVDLPCQVHDHDLWFAEAPADLELAKALCAGCPARLVCLSGAIDRREAAGVWGGEIFDHGQLVTYKRPRGRPRKNSTPPRRYAAPPAEPSPAHPARPRVDKTLMKSRSDAPAQVVTARAYTTSPRRTGRSRSPAHRTREAESRSKPHVGPT